MRGSTNLVTELAQFFSTARERRMDICLFSFELPEVITNDYILIDHSRLADQCREYHGTKIGV